MSNAAYPESVRRLIDAFAGMPGIGRMFALPKMKKYAHQIILGDDAELIAKFPEEKGKVTVLKMTGGKVTSVSYWSPETEALDTILK